MTHHFDMDVNQSKICNTLLLLVIKHILNHICGPFKVKTNMCSLSPLNFLVRRVMYCQKKKKNGGYTTFLCR